MTQAEFQTQDAHARPYAQLTILMLAAGVAYPLLYLRQNFEVSMLEAFNITNTQLGQCYSMLGVLFVASYVPSGWLADRISPRVLLTFSLAATGALGVWYWTLPSFTAMQIIFAGWGITTGLTFWAALIKETTLIAGPTMQGRFFGLLEGGRGVVEALLGSAAVAWFAWSLADAPDDTTTALQQVILMYVVTLLIMAPLVWIILGRAPQATAASTPDHQHAGTISELRTILCEERVWLAAMCIFSGYALFYATYSFAGFLQTQLGVSAVMAGWITVGRLWMRPIGGILAGFIGDRFEVARVLSWTLLACGVGLAGMSYLPAGGGIALIMVTVLTVALLTYAVRGIYWGTLESCGVSAQTKGLAIGIISLIGYSPEIWVPLLNGYLVDTYPGRTGYHLFYGGIGVLGILGALAGYRLLSLNHPQQAHDPNP